MKLRPKSNFLKASEVKDGDIIKFESEGEWIDSRFKKEDGTPIKQFVISVEWEGWTRDLGINSTNRQAMIDAYGDETKEWIGKKAKVSKVKMNVAGQIKDSIILEAA